MKKIGILGGTFDPIHIGHLIAADQAMFYEGLEEIWFMPALNPPHKIEQDITLINHRVEMVKRVVNLDSRYKLCTIELERKGPSYTLDTVRELKAKYPNHNFYFIIGGDMIKYLPKWYGIEELVGLIQFIGLERPGYEHNAIGTEQKKIYDQVKLVPMPQLDISSSQIRQWIGIGRTVRYVLPKTVKEYIEEHRLYAD